MSTPPTTRLRELLAHIHDPAQRLIVEQIIAELDVSRAHEQQMSGDAQLGVAVAGDSQGAITVDQSVQHTQTQGGDYAEGYIDKRVINILLAGSDTEAIIAALATAGVTADLKSLLKSTRQQRADQLVALLSHLSLPAAMLHRAFSKIAPFHILPEPSDGSLLQSILFELTHNTISETDPIERFARALLAEPDLTPAQESALCQWLGLPEQPQKKPDDPGLLIAIDKAPQSNELYHIFAWLWPDRLQLWPPVGEEMRSFVIAELPQAIKELYRVIYKDIARFGGHLRIELMLHHSLLVEPSHEWKIAILFDEDDVDDQIEQPLHVMHPVIVRSVERALSPKSTMADARDRWRTRWSQMPESCKRDWQRPQHTGAVQQPPIYCPTAAEDFDGDLFKQLIGDDYLCFVETVAPPEGMDFIRRVLLRVVRAGIPLGLWFAHNADRNTPIYQFIEGLLEPRQLSTLPHLLKQYWKQTNLARPLLFFDDPNRLPYDPDNAAFETPTAA